MKRFVSLVLAALVLGISAPACYGKFALANRLKSTVGKINNKWVQSFVVLLTLVVPIVLWVTYLLDALIFNAIEFWGGNNPLSAAEYDENGTAVRTVHKDGVTLKMTYQQFGQKMQVEVFDKGQQSGETFYLLKSRPGLIFTAEITGELRPVSRESLGLSDQEYADARQRAHLAVPLHSF